MREWVPLDGSVVPDGYESRFRPNMPLTVTGSTLLVLGYGFSVIPLGLSGLLTRLSDACGERKLGGGVHDECPYAWWLVPFVGPLLGYPDEASRQIGLALSGMQMGGAALTLIGVALGRREIRPFIPVGVQKGRAELDVAPLPDGLALRLRW